MLPTYMDVVVDKLEIRVSLLLASFLVLGARKATPGSPRCLEELKDRLLQGPETLPNCRIPVPWMLVQC